MGNAGLEGIERMVVGCEGPTVEVGEASREEGTDEGNPSEDTLSTWGCRLCMLQSDKSELTMGSSDRPDNTSKKAGCAMSRVDTVISISTAGTSSMLHFVRAAVRRLDSWGWCSGTGLHPSTNDFSSDFSRGGKGEGGGVNIGKRSCSVMSVSEESKTATK